MPENNKPSNTLFKQQRLPAWQPILSPPHVAACFVVIAVVFIPIGVAVMLANNDLVDLEYKYSGKKTCTPTNNEGVFQYTVDGVTQRMGCNVRIGFTLDAEVKAPVYLYYKLTNFYQNHRRFAKSRNDKQLAGETVSASSMTDTSPLLKPGEFFGATGTALTVGGGGTSYNDMVYNPAGLVAWSMFNDTFALYRNTSSTTRVLVCDSAQFDPHTNLPLANMSCSKKGIAWDSDVEAKYKTPDLGGSQWTALRSRYGAANITTSDPFLANGWYANESGHAVPVTTDEDFMVWMRTASLPTFRKLFRVINVNLPAGSYEMDIVDQYDVSSFDGEKAFVIATVSWAGGKNSFLAYAYIVVGAIVLVAAVIFVAIHKICGDRSQKAVEQLMQEMK